MVDSNSKSFVVSVPRTLLPVENTWTVRLASGLSDPEGKTFATPPQATATGTRVYNAAFRTIDDEPASAADGTGARMQSAWNNGRQSQSLSANDISPYAATINWSDLKGRHSTPEATPAGYSTRWHVSSTELGQGLNPAARGALGPALGGPQFFGRVQPYTVYVPSSYKQSKALPLTLLLHPGDGNHNSFTGAPQDDVYEHMCEERESICVTPLERGNNTWYLSYGELDVWEVWNRMAQTYRLDCERTVISGFSMGATGTIRFASNYPHLFAASVVVSGAGSYDTQGRRDQPHDPLRTENWRNLVTFMDSGSNDIALTATRRWDAAAQAAGVRYQANYYDGENHGSLGRSVGWSEAAAYLAENADTRSTSPATIAFRWEPGDERPDLGMIVDRAYWLSGLEPRDAGSTWSRVEANSKARPEPAVQPVLTDGWMMIDGRRVQVREQQWELGNTTKRAHEVTLDLANVNRVTVDLGGAGVPPSHNAAVTVNTDGPALVTQKRTNGKPGTQEITVQLEAGTHTISGR